MKFEGGGVKHFGKIGKDWIGWLLRYEVNNKKTNAR